MTLANQLRRATLDELVAALQPLDYLELRKMVKVTNTGSRGLKDILEKADIGLLSLAKGPAKEARFHSSYPL